MSIPAESRTLVAHFLNVSYPYSYSNSKFALIGEGVDELNEEFEADEEDIQYIHENTKTRNVKGYTVGFDIELKYIKDNELQIYANRMIRKPPIGLQTKGDYVRINIDEPMYGVENSYIGVRRHATVYPESVGGSADDVLGSSLHVSGNTEPEVGYMTFTEDGNGGRTYTWTPANYDVPIIISPENNSTVSNSSVTINGTGIAGSTITLYYGAGNGTGSPSTKTATVGQNGVWTQTLTSSELSVVADSNHRVTIAAKQTSANTSEESVTSQPITFTFTDVLLAPTITYPSNNATGVALSTTIRGNATAGATVTVQNTNVDPAVTIISSETVDSSGNWGKTVTLTASTTYKLTATQTLNGETSSESSIIQFTTTD